MPLTTTSGNTFPVAGVPTTQTPNSGSPAAQTLEPSKDWRDYSNWNGDFQGYLQYLDKYGSESDHDRFIDWLMTNESAKIARDWTASREDTQYQRLVDDLKKAGINPYALLNNGASPISSSSNGSSFTGAYSSNEALKKEANAQKWASLLSGVITSVVSVAMFAMMAL